MSVRLQVCFILLWIVCTWTQIILPFSTSSKPWNIGATAGNSTNNNNKKKEVQFAFYTSCACRTGICVRGPNVWSGLTAFVCYCSERFFCVSHILEYHVMRVQEFLPYGASLIRTSRTEQHSEGVRLRTPPLNVLVRLFSVPASNAQTSGVTVMKHALTDGT